MNEVTNKQLGQDDTNSYTSLNTNRVWNKHDKTMSGVDTLQWGEGKVHTNCIVYDKYIILKHKYNSETK